MFCRKCGNELADGAKFCNKCGAPVKAIHIDELIKEPIKESEKEASADDELPKIKIFGEDLEESEQKSEPVQEEKNLAPEQKSVLDPEQKLENVHQDDTKTASHNTNKILIIAVIILSIAVIILGTVFVTTNIMKNKSSGRTSDDTATILKGSNNSDKAEEKKTKKSEDKKSSDKKSEDKILNEDDASKTDSDAETQDSSPQKEITSVDELANVDYVLPESSTRAYTEEELMDMPSDVLRIARNEIYARHGRKFQDAGLQNYFNSKSWYKGTIETKDFTDNMLSDIERSNKDVIVKVEGIKAAENTAN
jgi:cytoskeletal protein RodZ